MIVLYTFYSNFDNIYQILFNFSVCLTEQSVTVGSVTLRFYCSCLRLCVLTWNMCLHLVYVSSTGIRVLTYCILCLRLEYTFMYFNEPLPLLGMGEKNHAPTIPYSSPLKSWTVTMDHGMDRCHYTVPFKGISIRSTAEIVLSSERINSYK